MVSESAPIKLMERDVQRMPAKTTQDAAAAMNAFRQQSQQFLNNNNSQSDAAPSPLLGQQRGRENLHGKNRVPSRRVDNGKPPLSGSAGIASGRGYLDAITDSSISESTASKGPSHRRAASQGTMISALTADSTSFRKQRPLISGTLPNHQRQTALEDRLMNKLLSKAHNNRNRSPDQMSYSASSVGVSYGTQSFMSSSMASTSYTDSKPLGMSDDASSFASTEEYSTESIGWNESLATRLEQENPLSEQDKKFIRMYFRDLEEERSALIAQWREEIEKDYENGSTFRRFNRDFGMKMTSCIVDPILRFLSYLEVFIANMPLTIGAVGLSWVTQGVIWFKFMEENMDACTTVRFYSTQCSYPEFPGCFECDTTNSIYRGVLIFHYFCHCFALLCCLLFLAKCAIAWRVVADELNNPTTSTPCGVVCITMICVAAGRGFIGEVVVILTSVFHILLSFWFLYIATCKFRQLPDPGWFPNTVGIAYAAVKTWLYFPSLGLCIMALCMVYLLFLFPTAIYRAYYNHKIAAPVCFISLSAPSITMYAMTIMAQSRPSGEVLIARDAEYAAYWNALHRDYYLPVQHFMMLLSLIGFASSLHCLWARWPQFKLKEFSPAHMAFIFPILSHANAVQAYRSGYISFSGDPIGSPFHITLYIYWLLCLVVGTLMNLVFTFKYMSRLPKWTKLDETLLLDNEMPPSPSHTFMHEMMSVASGSTQRGGGGGIPREIYSQSFTSPAVLQANEAGQLIRLRRGTEDYQNYGPYVRTRNISSLGFDLTLTNEELRQERAELLHWVAKNAPRTRNRTLSIPQMLKLSGGEAQDGHGPQTDNLYGTFQDAAAPIDTASQEGNIPSAGHQRSQTWTWNL